ncbi:hypothetical protein [Mycobacterium sp. PSTR-4-N]|uniref:hypothetical protein n=1 Tax=Mycobacterium sp. PSTR-4-N TaxID=2917745 RepID=UPI001F154CDC|nr:hypothetical protein [Mycobacterium sp. PSTR-4-N]MCG7596324.1 hypothetical protein [Mycobacterium sp. PSTR-4-N]
MIRAYLHRGAHRANRFSVRVADVQAAVRRAELDRQGLVEIDGKLYYQLRNVRIAVADWEPDSTPFVVVSADA